MKLSTLLLLACVGVCTASKAIRETLNFHDHVFNRVKRQFPQEDNGDFSSQLQSIGCGLQCLGEAASKTIEGFTSNNNDNNNNNNNFNNNNFNNNFNNINNNINSQFNSAFQTSGSGTGMAQFRDGCQNYRSTKECLRRCPSNAISSGTEILYDTGDYVCENNYQEWEQYIPCYQQVEAEVAANCTQQCGGVGQTIYEKYQQGQNQQQNQYQFQDNTQSDGLNTFFTIFMDASCSYIDCQTSCETPKIRERCGQRAVDLMQGLVRTSMNSVDRAVNSPGGQQGRPNNLPAPPNFPQNFNQQQNFGFQSQQGGDLQLPQSCRSLASNFNG